MAIKSSRSWILTQSAEKISFEDLQAALANYTYIGQKEKGAKGGEQGYEHYQIYIENDTPIKFETLKNKLPNAHIEPRRAKKKQKAYDYVTKSETKIGETFSNGEIDLSEEPGKRTDIDEILEMINNGATEDEVEAQYPRQMFRYSNCIKEARQRYLKRKYGKERRLNIEVTYIWGEPEAGKTKYVMDKYGDDKVYRVTGYKDSDHPFDDYNGQLVIMFEEFRSSFAIEKMLNFLDVYPLVLSARYGNKVACYEKVYIVTNEPLTDQYKNVQEKHSDTWDAFLRRIHYVWHMGVDSEPVPRKKLFPTKKERRESGYYDNLVEVDPENLPF